jgi:hypothetical protein
MGVLPWNSAKIYSNGFLTTFASTFNLPLCGIPITTFETPVSTKESKAHFKPGIKASQPSSPNLFEVLNLLAINN